MRAAILLILLAVSTRLVAIPVLQDVPSMTFYEVDMQVIHMDAQEYGCIGRVYFKGKPSKTLTVTTTVTAPDNDTALRYCVRDLKTFINTDPVRFRAFFQ